jgi:prepilin-type processing-associated H-X9-DG protein
LIELLVVISIIAVLAGLLLPAVSLVKAMSLKSTCASNQRQVYMAVQGYSNDWESVLPTQPMVTGETTGIDEYFEQASRSSGNYGSTAVNYMLAPGSKCPFVYRSLYPQIVSNAPEQAKNAILTVMGTALFAGVSPAKPYAQIRINGCLGATSLGSNGSPPTGIANTGSVSGVSRTSLRASSAMLFCGSGRWDSQGAYPDARMLPQFCHGGNPAVKTATSMTTATQSPVVVMEDGAVNVCFVDGHVESRKARKNSSATDFTDKEVPTRYFRPTSGVPSPACDFWGVSY